MTNWRRYSTGTCGGGYCNLHWWSFSVTNLRRYSTGTGGGGGCDIVTCTVWWWWWSFSSRNAFGGLLYIHSCMCVYVCVCKEEDLLLQDDVSDSLQDFICPS